MKYILLLISTLLFLASGSRAQDGANLFNRNCAACHTIGGGTKVGPDLAGVTSKRDFDWLVRFIRSSKEMIDKGDPDAVAIFEEFGKIPMPSHSNSIIEIQAMLEYIDSGGASPETAGQVNEERKALFEPDAERGKAMFTGNLALVNGGPSCISCHNIRHNDIAFGGLLAKDLSISYKPNIVEAMETSIPAMMNSYGKSALSVEERADLELFLQETKENQLYQIPGQFNGMFFLLGFVCFICILIIIHIFWKQNRQMGVLDEIFKRQLRTQ